jgi:hypothetical protein
MVVKLARLTFQVICVGFRARGGHMAARYGHFNLHERRLGNILSLWASKRLCDLVGCSENVSETKTHLEKRTMSPFTELT